MFLMNLVLFLVHAIVLYWPYFDIGCLISMTFRLSIFVLFDLNYICLVAGVRNFYDFVIITHITFILLVSVFFLVDRVHDSLSNYIIGALVNTVRQFSFVKSLAFS